MQNTKHEIEKLRKIFERAKNAPRDEQGWFEDLDLHREVGHALIVVGKREIYELEAEIYPYLEDPLADFREDAVTTLGWNNGLSIDDFRCNKAYGIFLKDPDNDVKVAALNAWGSYYAETKDSEVLKILYDILRSDQYYIRIRRYAYTLIYEVADAFTNRFYEINEILDIEGIIKSIEQFNASINWKRINKIMQDCVPGWNVVGNIG
jgi:hypothetical protein